MVASAKEWIAIIALGSVLVGLLGAFLIWQPTHRAEGVRAKTIKTCSEAVRVVTGQDYNFDRAKVIDKTSKAKLRITSAALLDDATQTECHLSGRLDNMNSVTALWISGENRIEKLRREERN